MKKKLLSVMLILAMTMSLAVGCGSNSSDTSDSGSDSTSENTDAGSNQILFNGSSTLAPVITAIATDFFDTYGTCVHYN